MKYLKLLCMAAAILMTACNKNGNNDNTPAKTTDENGVTSVLIREKDKGDFAKEIDITIKLSDITSTIEVKADPAEAVSQITYESEDVLIVRVTRQGNLYARRAGSTKVNVKIGETVYATANVTIVDDDSSKDPDTSTDPEGKIRLDDSHWFYYCYVCDEFEPIAKAAKHSSAGHFPTWYPYLMNICLMEDVNDMWSYLSYEDAEGNYTYSHTTGSDTYFRFDDEAGDGVFFDLNSAAPYPDIYNPSNPDPFCHGSLTLSFENERYVAGPFTCEAEYRGLVGWTDELGLYMEYKTTGKSRTILFQTNTVGISVSAGDRIVMSIMYPAFDSEGNYAGRYVSRSAAEQDWPAFKASSGDNSIVKVEQQGVVDNFWQTTLECAKAGSADVEISGTYNSGKLGGKRIVQITVK